MADVMTKAPHAVRDRRDRQVNELPDRGGGPLPDGRGSFRRVDGRGSCGRVARFRKRGKGRETSRARKEAVFGLVWALGLLLAGLAGCGAGESRTGPDTQRVTIAGRAFELELALTPAARYKGLSGRERIDARGGMLFVFPEEGRRQFVMRDCLVPIDLIFLDAGGRIVRMHEMKVEPADTPRSELTRYSSRYPAQAAIELKGGTLDQLNLSAGEKIDLPLAELKRRAE